MMQDSEQYREIDLTEEGLTQALRGLPARTPPPGMTTSLRVIASRERQRLLNRRSLRLAWAHWCDRAGLAMHNGMRPLALPFAGGVVSAIVLFSMLLLPSYPRHNNASGFDVPTMLSTGAGVKDSVLDAGSFLRPIGISVGDMVLDVTVDDQGRMVDYSVVSGANLLQDPTVRRRLENLLLFTVFVPATSFGQPMAGKIRLPLFLSQIDVKG